MAKKGKRTALQTYILNKKGEVIPEQDIIKWLDFMNRRKKWHLVSKVGLATISTTFLEINQIDECIKPALNKHYI
jgi:hypothetical protein